MKNVAARVCPFCGEEYLDEQTAARLLKTALEAEEVTGHPMTIMRVRQLNRTERRALLLHALLVPALFAPAASSFPRRQGAAAKKGVMNHALTSPHPKFWLWVR